MGQMNRQVIEECVGSPDDLTYGNRSYRVENDGASCRLVFIEGPYGKWRWQADAFEGVGPFYDDPRCCYVDKTLRSLEEAEYTANIWLSWNLHQSLQTLMNERFRSLLGDSSHLQTEGQQTYSAPTSFIPAHTSSTLIPVTDDQLMDLGLIPYPPLPPESRMSRWRRAMWERYWSARWWLAEIVAGQPIGEGDDW